MKKMEITKRNEKHDKNKNMPKKNGNNKGNKEWSKK